MCYLTTHSTHFIFCYMALDIGKGPFREREMIDYEIYNRLS